MDPLDVMDIPTPSLLRLSQTPPTPPLPVSQKDPKKEREGGGWGFFFLSTRMSLFAVTLSHRQDFSSK